MDPSLITKLILSRTQGLEVRGGRGSHTARWQPDSPMGRASPLQGREGHNRMKTSSI